MHTFIPETHVIGQFVQFSRDNIAILEDTLDGKSTYYGTQVAAFQRGKPDIKLGNAKVSWNDSYFRPYYLPPHQHGWTKDDHMYTGKATTQLKTQWS